MSQSKIDEVLEEKRIEEGADSFRIDSISKDGYIVHRVGDQEYLIPPSIPLIDIDDPNLQIVTKEELDKKIKELGLEKDEKNGGYIHPETGVRFKAEDDDHHGIIQIHDRHLTCFDVKGILDREEKRCQSSGVPQNDVIIDSTTRSLVFIERATGIVTSGINFGNSAKSLKKFERYIKNVCA